MRELIERQEAIDRFNVIRPVDPKKDEYTKGIDVGIAMCIVAVKDQPTIQPVVTDMNVGDTISRQAAIDAIANCTNCGNEKTLREYVTKHSLKNGWTGGVLDALDAVQDLPSVQPEPPWIPVSERLPEEHEWIGTKKFGTTMSDEVYVTFENSKGERFTKHLHFYNGELSSYDKTHMDVWYKDYKPIAWMPLPEPYKPNNE